MFMPWAKTFAINCAWVTGMMLAACGGGEEDLAPESKTFVLSDAMLAGMQLDTVTVRDMNGILNLHGKIVADENRMVEVYPIVGGNVLSVDVELGDYVPRNHTLAVIRSGEVAEYERQLTEAQSDMLVMQKNLSVNEDLFASKLISESELIAAQKEYEKAEASLKRVQETISIYGFSTRSEYYLKSPTSGFVIDKKISRDMFLPSGHNESVFTVAELSEVWALVNVYESDISRVHEGVDVAVSTLSYPGEVIHGKIDKIFNILDSETKTMKVRVRIPNPEFRLKPEMIAYARVTYWEGQALPSVPASAIVFEGGKNFVVVFRDRYNIHIREVEVQKVSNDMAWLRSGLEPGEIVVSGNQLFIYDALSE